MNESYLVSGSPFRHFTIDEMSNKECTEKVKLVWNPRMIEHGLMLDELRDFFGSPLNVSSWYRTKTFNKSCGGANNSVHLDGCATDFNNIPESMYQKMLTAWKAICISHNKVGGVELYSWGMHFDSYSDKFGYKTFRMNDNRKG